MPKAAVVASILVALAGCGGAGSAGSASNNGGGGNKNSGSSGGGGTGGGEDAAAGDDGASSDDGGIVNGNSWACPASTVLGEYSSQCVSCIRGMCGSQLQACETSDCSVCEGPTFSCEEQMCSSQCAPGGGSGSSSGSSGDGGGSGTTGSCAGLMTCCGYVAMFNASQGASCTMIAQSNNESACQGVIAMLPAQVAGFCQ